MLILKIRLKFRLLPVLEWRFISYKYLLFFQRTWIQFPAPYHMIHNHMYSQL